MSNNLHIIRRIIENDFYKCRRQTIQNVIIGGNPVHKGNYLILRKIFFLSLCVSILDV